MAAENGKQAVKLFGIPILTMTIEAFWLAHAAHRVQRSQHEGYGFLYCQDCGILYMHEEPGGGRH